MARKKTVAMIVIAAAVVLSGRVRAEGPDVHPRAIPRCEAEQMDDASPGEDVAAHRQFELPVLAYPAQAKLEPAGLSLTLLVDRSGQVVCHTIEDSFDREPEMTAPRRKLLRAMSRWHYRPFLSDGKPQMAVVSETVAEERLPDLHRPLPVVALDQVTISLERTGCFGTCPDYRVQVHGDGTVEYEGGNFVDVLGAHVYRIPQEQVEALVAKLRQADLWSMDKSYRAMITDNPSYELTLRMGDEVHEIDDYVGTAVGMPHAVRDFEEEVDRVARTSEWKNLSMAAVDRLQGEGFDFRSQAAADLLARAVVNDEGQDEPAMLRMIQWGTPVVGGNASGEQRIPPAAAVHSSLLHEALLHHRTALIDSLLARGALRTDGKLDRGKVDAAFRDAVEGGRLSLAQKIWNAAGPRMRPSLWFGDRDDNGSRRMVPMTMALSRRYGDDGWEGRQIAQWLAGLGCDLKARAADGATLLHRAVSAGDIDFVRYLIAKGLDVSVPGNYNLPPLASAENEDIALLLLQAGSDGRLDDHGESFRRYARQRHWGRVLAWLREHGG